MRTILITLCCVVLSGLAVTLMAEAPQLGLLKPTLSATTLSADS